VRLAVPKWASILLILSLIIVTLLFMCMVLGLTVQDVLANSEYYVLRLERLSNSMISFAETMGYDKERLKEMLPEFQAGTYVMQVLEFLFNRFPELILVLLIVVYMLVDLEDQEEQLLQHPRSLAARRAHRIDKHIRTYVFIHTLISLTAAVITTFVLFVFEVDFSLVVGLITFALGYIPNVGPAIAIVLPLPLIVLDPRPVIVRAVFITIFLAATQFSLTQLVEPRVLGRVMNIPPVTILVALLFWSSVWGIVGAIISVPLTVSIKMYLEALDHPAPQAVASFLMGNFQALDVTRLEVKEEEDVVDLQAPTMKTRTTSATKLLLA
jgi:predicted PurR-regulated permease PerM